MSNQHRRSSSSDEPWQWCSAATNVRVVVATKATTVSIISHYDFHCRHCLGDKLICFSRCTFWRPVGNPVRSEESDDYDDFNERFFANTHTLVHTRTISFKDYKDKKKMKVGSGRRSKRRSQVFVHWYVIQLDFLTITSGGRTNLFSAILIFRRRRRSSWMDRCTIKVVRRSKSTASSFLLDRCHLGRNWNSNSTYLKNLVE